MSSFLGCFCSRKVGGHPGLEQLATLASETAFTINEVEALHDLYKMLSNSIVEDGHIHKEELQLALFNGRSGHNLFVDRLFDLFNLKKNGVIDFEEFVRSLSIFHPRAPKADKIAFIFTLFDLRCTGYIEPEELKELVLAHLNESKLTLPDDAIDAIVNRTIKEADLKGDGKIDPEEWKELVAKHPSILNIMTIPDLKGVTSIHNPFIFLPLPLLGTPC